MEPNEQLPPPHAPPPPADPSQNQETPPPADPVPPAETTPAPEAPEVAAKGAGKAGGKGGRKAPPPPADPSPDDEVSDDDLVQLKTAHPNCADQVVIGDVTVQFETIKSRGGNYKLSQAIPRGLAKTVTGEGGIRGMSIVE